MILRPRLTDLKVVGLYSGKILLGVGWIMLVPLLVSLLSKEWNAAGDFFLGFATCMVTGFLLQALCQTTAQITWGHGLTVACFSWFLASVLGAIPGWLSGHYGSFLDACFDLMSGLTTTGLFLLQDLDHVSNGFNTWRHLLSWVGGQGLVVLALSFFSRGAPGVFTIFVGEAKEERLEPNIIGTARDIWAISLSFMAVGVASLTVAGAALGLSPAKAFLHGWWMFMGAWSTGGFAPMSGNLSFYHSPAFELLAILLMTLGSLNFALHWAVWSGDRREIRRNIETVAFAVSFLLTLALVAAGLSRAGAYPEILPFLRKALVLTVSAHTTTGFSTVDPGSLLREWGPLAALGLMTAMAVGGSACSTAGGFKGMRIGIIFQAVRADIRRLVSPESVHVVEKWHHLRTRVLEGDIVRHVYMVVLLFVGLYALTTAVGVYYGHPFLAASFEAISAGSNSGLSCGVTHPGMPDGLKVTYLLAMWAGRLEFMSLFALGAFLYALWRGK